jgi:hypothetical protein
MKLAVEPSFETSLSSSSERIAVLRRTPRPEARIASALYDGIAD